MVASRAGRVIRNESGAALLASTAVVFATLILGSALFLLGTSESDLVEHEHDGLRAFYLAEGGVQRARTWIEEYEAGGFTLDPEGVLLEDQVLGEGVYTISIADTTGDGVYTVVATGDVGGVVRQVKASVIVESIARYQFFIDRANPKTWFETPDRLDGPVHMNGPLRVRGDPWFEEHVTASDGYVERAGSDPTFEKGCDVNADEVSFPDRAETESSLRSAALDGGLHGASLRGGKAYYEVVLGRNGAFGSLSYRSYERIGGSYHLSDWDEVEIEDLNGVAWFDDCVHLSGTLDGVLTIGSSETMEIVGDVVYEGYSPGSGIDEDCDDLLGIVGSGKVLVGDTPPNESDCVICGACLALRQKFQVERWNSGPTRGTLSIHGGVVSKNTWKAGRYRNGVLRNGYEREWHYDPRIGRLPRSLFPKTGTAIVVRWEEVYPPEV